MSELVFNKSDGSFQISDYFKITRQTTLNELTLFFGKKHVNIIDVKNGWLQAHVRNVKIGGYWFCFLFFYFDSLLHEIHFVLNDEEFVGDWSDWSETKEMRRLKLCENWLYRQIGTQDTHFSWGRIKAYYDSKGGGALIGLRYEQEQN